MKKKLITTFVIALSYLFIASPASAATLELNPTSSSSSDGCGNTVYGAFGYGYSLCGYITNLVFTFPPELEGAKINSAYLVPTMVQTGGNDFTVKVITGQSTNVTASTAFNTSLGTWLELGSTNAFSFNYALDPDKLEQVIDRNSGLQLRQDPMGGHQMVYLYSDIATLYIDYEEPETIELNPTFTVTSNSCDVGNPTSPAYLYGYSAGCGYAVNMLFDFSEVEDATISAAKLMPSVNMTSGSDFAIKVLTGSTVDVDNSTTYATDLTPWLVLGSSQAYSWPYKLNPSYMEDVIARDSGLQVRQDPTGGNQGVFLMDDIFTLTLKYFPAP